MDYNECIKVISTTIKQHRNGYAITQADYNNYLDALDVLLLVKERIEVTK